MNIPNNVRDYHAGIMPDAYNRPTTVELITPTKSYSTEIRHGNTTVELITPTKSSSTEIRHGHNSQIPRTTSKVS